ncbi:MAG: YceI family protein [Bacteroidia bacterium]
MQKTNWAIDPSHSEIGFKIGHLMISNVKGNFLEFDSDISTTGEDFSTAEVNVWIHADSIDTHDKKRDEHLKGPDFFDVDKYKEITFTGGKLKKSGKTGTFDLEGDLKIRDITNSIKLTATYGGKMKDLYGNDKAGFVVTGSINRKDWELGWNALLTSGGMLLSDSVQLNCEVQLIKKNSGEVKMQAENTQSEELIV